MTVPHPVPYQGSKRHLARHILEYVPANTSRLVEPFAGSGALTIAAASSGKSRQFWLNDIHAPLINLWRHIIEQPEALPESLNLTCIELDAGRSSQATLLGRSEKTVESLYLSPVLPDRLYDEGHIILRPQPRQLPLFEVLKFPV